MLHFPKQDGLFADERLQGKWKVIALVDQGIEVAPENIRDELAKYAQLDVEGSKVKFIAPGSNELRVLSFSIDPATVPSAITLVNEHDQVIKGIYRVDGDKFEVCLGAPDAADRPIRFESTATNRSLFLTLKSLNPAPLSDPVATVAQVPETKSATALEPANRQLYVEALDDTQLAQRVAGSWRYRDRDSDVLVTLNPDGTFSLIREFTQIAKMIFHPESRTSGRWNVEDGRIVVKVTAAWGADKRKRLNQVASYRINTISATEMIMISVTGELIRATRVG